MYIRVIRGLTLLSNRGLHGLTRMLGLCGFRPNRASDDCELTASGPVDYAGVLYNQVYRGAQIEQASVNGFGVTVKAPAYRVFHVFCWGVLPMQEARG